MVQATPATDGYTRDRTPVVRLVSAVCTRIRLPVIFQLHVLSFYVLPERQTQMSRIVQALDYLPC